MLYPTNRTIPANTDTDLIGWAVTFDAGITAAPATYGTDVPTAAALAAALVDLQAAYALAGVANRVPVNPAGYTQPNRADLYVKRAAFLDLARPLATAIQVDNSITDENKLLIGVQPKNLNRTPIYAPATAPVLGFLAARVGTHTIGFADTLTPAQKIIPAGAIGMELYVGVDAAQSPLAACPFRQVIARWPATVNFDPGDAGKVATYFGRWVGRRGDTGPWSAALAVNII